MSGLTLYFLLKLTAIGLTLIWLGAVLLMLQVVFMVVSACYAGSSGEDWWPIYKKFRPVFNIIFGVILIIFGVMVPSTKQAAVIYVVPKVANSQIMEKIPQKILLLSEEWFEELRPKNTKEGKNTSDNNKRDKINPEESD